MGLLGNVNVKRRNERNKRKLRSGGWQAR